MLYVEGKPDQVLALRITGFPRSEIRSERNKQEVLKTLSRQSSCQAMVDEDPGEIQPFQLRQMRLVDEHDDTGLRVYRDRQLGNQVVVICPRLEEWLTDSAKEVNIDLANRRYNLPRNPVSLHRVINRDLRKLNRLIDDLLAAQSPRILKLKELLTQ